MVAEQRDSENRFQVLPDERVPSVCRQVEILDHLHAGVAPIESTSIQIDGKSVRPLYVLACENGSTLTVQVGSLNPSLDTPVAPIKISKKASVLLFKTLLSRLLLLIWIYGYSARLIEIFRNQFLHARSIESRHGYGIQIGIRPVEIASDPVDGESENRADVQLDDVDELRRVASRSSHDGRRVIVGAHGEKFRPVENVVDGIVRDADRVRHVDAQCDVDELRAVDVEREKTNVGVTREEDHAIDI